MAPIREWWINVYPNTRTWHDLHAFTERTSHSIHRTQDEADKRACTSHLIRCVHVREVHDKGTDPFVFAVGEWTTNAGEKAVVLHRLMCYPKPDVLIGYIENALAEQRLATWRPGGGRGSNPYSADSLKRPEDHPIEWWVNVYKKFEIAAHTKAEAMALDHDPTTERVRVREVLGEDK